MDRITVEEIQKLTETCLSNLKSDELYRLRNDAKLRAVNSSKNYDEFKWEVDTIKFWYNAKHHFLSNTNNIFLLSLFVSFCIHIEISLMQHIWSHCHVMIKWIHKPTSPDGTHKFELCLFSLTRYCFFLWLQKNKIN